MTFLNATINNLNQTILYHQQQIEETQNQLDQVKVSATYGEEASASVEEAIANISSEHLELLKEHLLSLFEKPLTEVPLREPQHDISHTQDEEIQNSNLEKIDSEITYNHVDSICYMAFSAKGRADNYGSYLTRILDIAEKYTVSKDPQIVDAKYELRLEGCCYQDALHLQSFNLKKDWNSPVNEEARELWRNSRKREVEPACKPLPKLASIEEINLGEIVYLNSHSTQYKVLQKVNYGGVPHLEVICVFNLERPSLVGATSYLKEAYRVLPDDIQIDPQFQASSLRLKDEAPRSSTQEKQEAPKVEVVKEKPKPILKTKELSEGDFPIGPYRRISLDDIEVSDVVSTGANIKGYYEIYQHNGDHVLGRCLYHDSLKMRIGQDGYYIKDAYLVEKASLSIAA